MNGRRFFIALALPDGAGTALLDTMGGVAGARWQSAAQLHCTVRFLGDVDRHDERDVMAALRQVRHPAIDATLDGLGTFDRRGRVDTLWVGVSPLVELRALHARVERVLALVGVAPDPRAYTPHVTLARFGRPVVPPADLARKLPPPPPIACRFERLNLYESLLGRDGATYEMVASRMLG